MTPFDSAPTHAPDLADLAAGAAGGTAVPRARLAGIAAAALAGIILLSQLVELFINRVVRPDLKEWTWISDVILIAALLVLTVLWARLRLAQTAIAGLERERLTIQTELAVAARVQQALLPVLPEPVDGIAWYAAAELAGQVGGDYYDFFHLADGRMCVVLADVSGKGVPAAVFVSNTRAVLRAVARERPSPAALLAAVSEVLPQDGRGELYVTAIVAIVDTAARTMAYANAGHPPGLLLHADLGLQPLDTGGPPLGLLPDAAYGEEQISLRAGDLVVLVSDGITEAMDAGGRDIPRVLKAQLEHLHLRDRTPAAACATLLARARHSSGPLGGARWDDDRTVVAFGLTADAPARPA